MKYLYNNTEYESLNSALQDALPTYNSDSKGQTKPMLATDWNKIKNLQFPCFIEPKLDGVRCLMIVDGANGNVTFLSRSGKEYSALRHIKSHFSIEILRKLPEGFILDGEIYSDELTFQEIVSAVKAEKDNSKLLKFRAYDIVSEEPQSIRRTDLRNLIDDISSNHIQIIEWEIAQDASDVKSNHDAYVQAGYEGAILRLFDGKYAQGQRSRELLKVKEFDENEYPLLRFELGQREEDLIAVCKTADGSEFRAKMMGNREQKAKINIKDDIEGLYQLTVKHFGYTEDGLPRFPIGKTLRDYE